jgi:hypothetical protein
MRLDRAGHMPRSMLNATRGGAGLSQMLSEHFVGGGVYSIYFLAKLRNAAVF